MRPDREVLENMENLYNEIASKLSRRDADELLAAARDYERYGDSKSLKDFTDIVRNHTGASVNDSDDDSDKIKTLGQKVLRRWR